jgi:Asp-tRNA(Asn)/Glu-tRNA(Gln) amidotransferase A subunit family amidase
MTDLDLCFTPAHELARLYRSKELSPVDVVQNSLNRIADVNPALNCFCFTYPEEALEKARAAEQTLMSDGDNAPAFTGIPIAIKDFTPTEGKTTTRGSHLLENWVPDWNPVLVQRLEAAGAIMVGKTTTPEFATSGFTNTPLWGVTRNPWDTTRTPGGSSGGSGAAVSSGCVPIAEGTDMGGSVRIPAGLCGIVGLKPSLGRIPMDIIDNVFDNISHFGPLARTVTDATMFLDTVQGEHPSDIQSLPRCDLSIPSTPDVKGLKIALNVDLGFYAVDPGVEANLRTVADALRDAGADVTEVALDWDKSIVDDWTGTWGVFMAAAYAKLTDVPIAENQDRMSKGLVALVKAGQKVDAVTQRMWEFRRTVQWQKLGTILDSHHALLCPTMCIVAPSADLSDNDFDDVDGNGKLHGMDMTSPFNYTAQCPALSVPSGFSDGMPTGAQIVARKWDDALALRIGAAIEQAMPWAQERPTT